jgi:hypothetical protein
MADKPEEVVETPEIEADSLGDDLRATIDAYEGDGDGEEVQAAEPEAQEETPPEISATEEQPPEISTESAPQYKPPIDWSPALREEFSKLPDTVKKAISQREGAVATLMQRVSGERRTAQEFRHLVSEYQTLMAAEGVQDPLQGMRGLLATTSVLASGTPQNKAAKIADLIRHYGVDVNILDQALVGEVQTAPPPPSDPRIDWLFNRFQQAEQESQYQIQAQANQTIHEFSADPKNEFFDLVRGDMADILDLKTARGETINLNEAYDRACAMNPEITATLAQRRAEQSGAITQEHLAGKAAAASSVTGSQGATPEAGLEGGSIRDILNQQFSEQGRI